MPYGENEPHGPGVVALPKPHVDDMLAMIDRLRTRVAAGEFETLWVIGWTPDNHLLSVERGKPKDRLWKIGTIECFKQDLIGCMDTGEASGF